MLTALDHIVLLCPDIETAVADYARLLGVQPVWRARDSGSETAVFSFQNTALELLAPVGEGDTANRLRAMVVDGAKIVTLVYRSDSITQDHHLLQRRGLSPSDITNSTSTDLISGDIRQWQRFRIPDEVMSGVKTFVVQPQALLAPVAGSDDTVSALDHLVIQTPNIDRCVANYGARLGIRLALDRRASQWKTHFLFFRAGDCTIEVVHRLNADHDIAGMDKIWGLTWATRNLEAAHRRLVDAGIDVSEIRDGRKPGSTVFTVRSGTLGIPTLFIAHAAR
jgi:catechol 2,3-dioxygenase-like lactoylglutathione lyase family enzyme